MDFLTQLWIPILVSAAAVWILSFLFWAVLPFHHKDFKSLPDEAAVTGFIRQSGIPAGNYVFPNCPTHGGKRDAEFQKRWKDGPAGTLSVWPNVNMGRNMVLTLLVYLVVSILIAYLGASAIIGPASKGHVFQVLGTAGVLAYSFAFLPNGIWFNHTPGALLRNLVEGVVYGLATGAVFAFFWPGV